MKKIVAVGIMITLSMFILACGNKGNKTETKQTEEKVSEEQEKVEEEEKVKQNKVYDSSAAFAKYQAHEEIFLWENKADMPFAKDGLDALNPTIAPYIAQNNTSGGCVIVCPGGGYVQLAREKEGSEITEALNQNNITAFMLEYRTSPYDGNAAMADVFRAIRYVRYHAEEFGINPNKISVMGFSAGGHLATMATQHYEEDEQALDEIDKVSARPDFGILCYPVVSLKDEVTHGMTKETFLGEENVTNAELIKKYSGEEQVTKDMPPVFIWCCENDNLVTNSQLLADALEAEGVSHEVHIYPKGKHGIGLGIGYGEAEQWFPTCITWLRNNGY